MIRTIKPPNSISRDTLGQDFTIFLASSIEMGKADDWQTSLTKVLTSSITNRLNITIFNPRRDDWDSSWEHSIDNPQFREHVEWELEALEKSNMIIMYFDPNTKSPITLLELGLYAQSDKLVVCCPDGFCRKGNVEIVANRYGFPCFDTMPELINYVLNEIF